MNILPGTYIAAIDREIADKKKDISFAKSRGAGDLVQSYELVIMGMEVAKSLIKRTYHAHQEIKV